MRCTLALLLLLAIITNTSRAQSEWVMEPSVGFGTSVSQFYADGESSSLSVLNPFRRIESREVHYTSSTLEVEFQRRFEDRIHFIGLKGSLRQSGLKNRVLVGAAVGPSVQIPLLRGLSIVYGVRVGLWYDLEKQFSESDYPSVYVSFSSQFGVMKEWDSGLGIGIRSESMFESGYEEVIYERHGQVYSAGERRPWTQYFSLIAKLAV
ncbi:hypothetical protein [Sanyastnella coralliicola]|uniref:hypothetical protein n=1 Tax=Sanyastnella coralliicola TaxID=3069118 RepID=UPI0027B998FF|nr:hypothetical protein [Longitalea sp. SCSIO 12813]